MLNRANAERISKLLGKLIDLDLREEGALYFRMKIEVNLEGPLIPGFPLKLKSGCTKWVDVKYERLPTFCYVCGRMGHDSKTCASESKNDNYYGPWLRAENKQMSPMFLASEANCSSSRETFPLRQALTEVTNRETYPPQNPSDTTRQSSSTKGLNVCSPGGIDRQEKENRRENNVATHGSQDGHAGAKETGSSKRLADHLEDRGAGKRPKDTEISDSVPADFLEASDDLTFHMGSGQVPQKKKLFKAKRQCVTHSRKNNDQDPPAAGGVEVLVFDASEMNSSSVSLSMAEGAGHNMLPPSQ